MQYCVMADSGDRTWELRPTYTRQETATCLKPFQAPQPQLELLCAASSVLERAHIAFVHSPNFFSNWSFCGSNYSKTVVPIKMKFDNLYLANNGFFTLTEIFMSLNENHLTKLSTPWERQPSKRPR